MEYSYYEEGELIKPGKTMTIQLDVVPAIFVFYIGCITKHKLNSRYHCFALHGCQKDKVEFKEVFFKSFDLATTEIQEAFQVALDANKGIATTFKKLNLPIRIFDEDFLRGYSINGVPFYEWNKHNVFPLKDLLDQLTLDTL